MLPEISFDDFTKIQICAGTVIEVKTNEKAKAPAYILTVDFGELGVKTSSAQITQHYDAEDLMGKQILAVMNFPAKRVAGVKSEVLVLGCVSSHDGTILIEPNKLVENGARVL